jgi:hypothetical protein
MRINNIAAALSLAGLLALAPAAKAGVLETFDLAWSGASFGNGATATGQIVLDISTLPNPQLTDGFDLIGSMNSLSVTVTGATSGNGTWTKADLAPLSALSTNTYWWTGGVALNLNMELVGQPTNGNPWGTPDGTSGDFNLFFTHGGPIGTFFFTMTTAPGVNGAPGDPMRLTEFAPEVPEPGTCILLFTGLSGLAVTLRRKQAK